MRLTLRTLAPLLALGVVALSATADAQRRRRNQPNDDQPSIRDLDTVVPRLQSQNADEVREAIDLLAAMDHPDVVPHLAELLRSGLDDRLTDRALQALRVVAEPNAIEVLSEFTNHRRVAARRKAYQALAQIEDRRIPAILERGLRDSDRSVRGAAALALGSIGTRGSLDLLFHAFDRGVIEAAIAIGKLGNEASVERYAGHLGDRPLGVMLSGFEQYLKRDDIDLETKTQIVERLGEVAGPMVRRFLQDHLNTLPERPRGDMVEYKRLVERTIRRIPETAQGTTIRSEAS